jgi:hypothetical protein
MATLTAVEQRQIDHYVERVKAAEKETHVDNSSLYAGSPMYYYCRECGVFITSLPESHTCAAPSLCDGCKKLTDQELLPEARAAVKVAKKVVKKH